MATLAKDNPLKPVADRVDRIRGTLADFLRNILGNIRPLLKKIADFVSKVRASFKEIAEKVGKKVVNSLLSMADEFLSLFAKLEQLVTNALKLAAKVLALILKAADPAKVLKAVKALVQRYVKAVRRIHDFVARILSTLSPIETALKVIDSLSSVLRFVISWITDASGASASARKAKSLFKKGVKSIKTQLKEATALMKEVNSLKIAA